MAKFSVLIADDRYDGYDEEKKVLASIDADISFERSSEEDVLVSRVAEIDALIVNLAPITERVIEEMKNCKCISRYGVGYDNVDVEAVKKAGMCLANVADYCREDVSDHAMALFLDCVRKISRKDRHVRDGEWNLANIQAVHRIQGRTFGLVGYGMIARAVHRKLRGFELGRVLVSDPVVSDAEIREAGAEPADLETLCRESDYISLHAPVLPSTRGMMGAEQFRMMKSGAVLINTARGPLIDERALVDALKDGPLACAGLDVFENEPLPEESALRCLDNVTITDHAGWYSEEARKELKTKAAENVALVLSGKPPLFSVVP